MTPGFSSVKEELDQWREAWSWEDYLRAARKPPDGSTLTLTDLFSGMGMCTLGGVRSGLSLLWNSEIVPEKQMLLESMTGAKCYGDTFCGCCGEAPGSNVMWACSPCIDYSLSGTWHGEEGSTGWMFVEMGHEIVKARPDAVIIEQSANARFVDNGSALQKLRAILETHYTVTERVVKLWKYGDPSNRERIFLVGIHRDVNCETPFEFPPYVYDEKGLCPTYRDIAVPDEMVPEQYWRYDDVPLVEWQEPRSGKLHKIAQVGCSGYMGYSANPASVYSMDSLPNAQTRYNGGGRRPPLDWKRGDPLERTRLAVIDETRKICNLPEGAAEWIASFNPAAGDAWIRDCTAQGVPLRTGYNISKAVKDHLLAAGVKPRGERVQSFAAEVEALLREEVEEVRMACKVHLTDKSGKDIDDKISALVDTGCFPKSMFPCGVNGSLIDPTTSHAKIEIADDSRIAADLDGRLRCTVLNTSKVKGCDQHHQLEFNVTTSKASRVPLLSLDGFWSEGWDTHLTQVGAWMEKDVEGEVLRVPFRRGESGGWWIDLALNPNPNPSTVRDWKGSGKCSARAALQYNKALDKEDELQRTGSSKGKQNPPPEVVNSFGDPNAGTLTEAIAAVVSHDDVTSFRVVIDPHDDGGSDELRALTEYCKCCTESTGIAMSAGTGEDHDDDGGAQGDGTTPANVSDSATSSEDEGEGEGDSDEDDELEPEPEPDLEPKKRQRKRVRKPKEKSEERIGYREYEVAHREERRFLPTKRHLRNGKNKESWKVVHEDHAHMGTCKGCPICVMAKGNPRRISMPVDKAREERRGVQWVMDAIEWSHRSSEGYKFMVILRDAATDYVKFIYLKQMKDILPRLEEFIKQERRAAYFQNTLDKPFAKIKTDLDPTWAPKVKKVRTMLNRIGGCTLDYHPPDDKRKRRAGLAERTNGIAECYIKAVLMQQNLPPHMWSAAARDVEFLMNRSPTYRSAQNVSDHGDGSSPIELYTNEAYGRSQVYSDLSYYIQVGTPCLVYEKDVKGSSLQPKSTWRIAWGMDGSTPVFRHPTTHHTKRSKSFTAFRLREGLNYAQFLGLGNIPSTRASAKIPQDYEKADGYIVDLGPLKLPKDKVAPIDPTVVETVDVGVEHGPRVTCSSEPQLRGTVPKVVQLRGADEQAKVPEPQGDGAQPLPEGLSGEATGEDADPNVANPNPSSTYLDMEVGEEEADAWSKFDKDSDNRARSKVKHRDRTTGSHDKFESFARSKLKIPNHLVQVYLRWLLDHPDYELTASDGLELGVRNVTRLPPDITLPYPSGRRWEKLVEEHTSGAGHPKNSMGLSVDKLLQEAEFKANMCAQLLNQVKGKNPQWRCESDTSFIMTCSEEQHLSARAARRVRGKKHRVKAVGGEDAPPRSVTQAITHPTRGLEWVKSLDKEFFGLCKLGVFKLGYTMRELKAMGITSKPVPLSTVFDHKHSVLSGILEKLKSRIVLSGHPGNMTKGVHYESTFAATPVGSTERVLNALMVKLGLERLAFDIKQAYLHAEMESGYDAIICEYPQGYQEWNGDEKLYILLNKNIYGHPSGAANWEAKRNEFVCGEEMRSRGWRVTPCWDTDPCLFYIEKGDEYMWALIHTDDTDCYGSCKSILEEFRDEIDKQFGIAEVPAEVQLGVKREYTTDPKTGVRSVRLTMPVFIDGMAAAFCDDESYPKRDVSVPFNTEDGGIIDLAWNKANIPEAEAKQVLAWGYQRLIGMIMWCARHVCPECQYGASMLSRVLSWPSVENWKWGLRMVKWMHQVKLRGIRFTSDADGVVRIFVDSSNKPDSLSYSQAGHVAMWMGGPIVWESKRNGHPDHCAPRNEYYALFGMLATVRHLRDLNREANMGVESLVDPVKCYTDSSGAKRYVEQNKITQAFKIIRAHYHMVRAAARLRELVMLHIRGEYNPADLFTKANVVGRIRGNDGTCGVDALCGYEQVRVEGSDNVDRYDAKHLEEDMPESSGF